MSLFWQNPQTHAAAHSVCLISYEFQIICKIFLTSILEPTGTFRVCFLQGQVNLKYWPKEEQLYLTAIPCVRSNPEKSILNSAAQVKRQTQTQIPGENPKV